MPIRRLLFLLVLMVPILLGIPAIAAEPSSPQVAPSWQACFTPGEDCTGLIVRQLYAAQKTVLVQAYSFTSEPIARELADAHRRGVEVHVILDKSNRTEKYSAADFLAHAGIAVLIDSEHRIAHNKVMVIDGETVITGSFNFTKAAQLDNAENVLVIHSQELAKRYSENWQRHARHSEPYGGHGQ